MKTTNLKYIALFFAMVVFMATTAFANDGEGKRKRAKRVAKQAAELVAMIENNATASADEIVIAGVTAQRNSDMVAMIESNAAAEADMLLETPVSYTLAGLMEMIEKNAALDVNSRLEGMVDSPLVKMIDENAIAESEELLQDTNTGLSE